MKNKTLIIQGSSRGDGDTNMIVNHLNTKVIHLIKIDLVAYRISYFDYDQRNAEDDFILLMEKIISQYDTFVFATPVYWYAMSGRMKVFF